MANKKKAADGLKGGKQIDRGGNFVKAPTKKPTKKENSNATKKVSREG